MHVLRHLQWKYYILTRSAGRRMESCAEEIRTRVLSSITPCSGQNGKIHQNTGSLCRQWRGVFQDFHTTNLTFDVIGAVTMDQDMDAQAVDPKDQGDIVRWMKDILVSK